MRVGDILHKASTVVEVCVGWMGGWVDGWMGGGGGGEYVKQKQKQEESSCISVGKRKVTDR